MSKQIEAMNLALEALEKIGLRDWVECKEKSITAIREALAHAPPVREQPAQQHIEHCIWARNGNAPCPHVQPAQQQQEPPTVAELLCVCGAEWEWRNRDWELVATPTAQQEPVAWVWKDGTVTTDPDRADGTWMPLYASPQPSQRSVKPWVGLTTEDRVEILRARGEASVLHLTEAKLKEKNGF